MDGLITIAQFVAAIVTIIGGFGTAVRVVQQVMPARTKTQPEPIRVPVSMPQAADVQGSAPTAASSRAPSVPAVPPSAPDPLPAASVPTPAFPQPAPSYGAVASAPIQQTRIGQKRRVSFLVIALAGILTQGLWFASLFIAAGNNDLSTARVVGFLGFFAMLVNLIFVIYAATKAIQLRRWGWLAEVILGTLAGFLFLSGVALIIFGLFAPSHPRESRASIPVVSSRR